MAKYSYELKKKVVDDYLKGMGDMDTWQSFMGFQTRNRFKTG